MGNTPGITRTIVQTAILMSILTLVSKCFGFLREMVMANYYGTTYVTDAYVMAFTILSVLFGGLIFAISTAYIPLFSKINERKGNTEGDLYTSGIINILLAITIIISIIGIIFSKEIISILASGFHGETADLASFYIKVLFSYIIFSSTASILDSYMQYKGIFLPQVISGYLVSICTIAAIVISARYNDHYLAFGVVLGYALRFIVMNRIAKKNNYRHTFTFQYDRHIKEMIVLAIPTFIGSYMLYLNQFVDKTIASGLKVGSISALNYASLLNNMIMGITITILTTMIYPKLTKANSLQQYDRFNSIISTGLNLVVLIALPCSLGAMIYNDQLIQLVYERGVFDSTATAMTSSAFFYYAAGLLFMSVNDLMIRVYYSIHDMKTPMVYSAIGVIINVILNLILVQYMAHSGLALATSIASLCSTVMLYYGLRHKYSHIKVFSSGKKLIKIAAAAIVSIGLSYAVYSQISLAFNSVMLTRFVQLLIPVAVAAMSYLLLLSIFKVDEVKLLRQIIKRNS